MRGGSYPRRDGRQGLEMRAKELRLAELTHFDGSSWYAQGRSSALVAIHGPTTAKPLEQDPARCRLRVRVLHAASVPTSGGSGRLLQRERARIRAHQIDAHELAGVVERALDAVFLAERFPYTVLAVDVVVMGVDGGLLAVVLNAVMCALLSAGVPCRTTMAAVAVAALRSTPAADESEAEPEPENEKEHENAEAQNEPPKDAETRHEEAGEPAKKRRKTKPTAPALELLLDPTAEEEGLRVEPGKGGAASATPNPWRCIAHGTFVFANPKAVGGLLASHVRRNPGAPALAPTELAAMATLAARGANALFDFFRQCNVPLE